MKNESGGGAVAVLLPVYNPGKEFAWTIESLRNQTTPFKLFLVDDGSTQKPVYDELLDGLDYQVVNLEINQGVAAAANAGIQAILVERQFDFIARIDCGDWSIPNRLEIQLRGTSKNTKNRPCFQSRFLNVFSNG